MSFDKLLAAFAVYSVLTLYVLSEASVGNYNGRKQLANKVNSDCGGVFNDSTGQITYKLEEPLLPNERCVWIIRAPDAGGYDISIDTIGLPLSLTISSFGNEGRLLTYPATEPHNFHIPNAYVLVITLHTGPDNNTDGATGFSMGFEGVANRAGEAISKNSTHTFISADSGHHKFPSGRPTYNNSEMSTFVVTPLSDGNGNFKNTEVVYALKGLEQCWDFLEVFLFNSNPSTLIKWAYQTTLCNQNETIETAVITHNDLILLVFVSDELNVDTGFHLFANVDNC